MLIDQYYYWNAMKCPSRHFKSATVGMANKQAQLKPLAFGITDQSSTQNFPLIEYNHKHPCIVGV